jgi:hypothetical protein
VLGYCLSENHLFSRIRKLDYVRDFAVAGAHKHDRMRGEVEFVRLGLGYLFSKRRRHVMELDTGRHGITDRFGRASRRLWHVQVFEHNLLEMKLCSAVRLMGP